MNNYWHTNYKADQEGPVTLRYGISPHAGSEPATAKRLAAEFANPLIAVPTSRSSALAGFPLTVQGAAFVATRLKPMAGGRGHLLRLYNASSRPARLVLAGAAAEAGRVFLSDIDGAPGGRLTAPLEVPASGIVTLLVK
jgi:hypothetical protein